MKSTRMAVVLFASGALFSTPLAAQDYAAPAAPNANKQPQESSSAAKPEAGPKMSPAAAKAIQELQKAVNENNTAAIPQLVAAADAAAKTKDDRYIIASLRLKAAASGTDQAAIASAIEALLASGGSSTEEQARLYRGLGETYSKLKQYDRSAQAFQHALQLNASDVDATAGLAEAEAAQGHAEQALATIRKGIALQSAGGTKAPESWYKRAVAIAYKAKMPQALEVARQWLEAYPSATAWHDTLAIYQNSASLDDDHKLDLMRLKRVTGALGAADYFDYGALAVQKGYPGEAKAVVDEGLAANAIKRSDTNVAELDRVATSKAKGDRDTLPAAPASANWKAVLSAGDAYYGYGDYSKAAEFYRAALAKAGADANLVNLHLGMTLARQGDKAGAAATLAKASGSEAELAKLWLLYVNSKT